MNEVQGKEKGLFSFFFLIVGASGICVHILPHLQLSIAAFLLFFSPLL